MLFLNEARTIERPTFFNGQRLFASDLQDIEAFNRELRWLHNLSLHQPGVGQGLAVFGNKGDRAVLVQPGYALDAFGREIILTADQQVAVPPVAGTVDGKPAVYDLTIAYPENVDLEIAESREGVCLPRGAVRLREEPVFCWADPTDKTSKLVVDVKMNLRLVLARVEIQNCKLTSAPDTSLRRSARPARQPYVAAGREIEVPKHPLWKAWKLLGTTDSIGLSAHVDTRTGQFLTTPAYTAHIEGTRPIKQGSINLIDGSTSIEQADHEQFDIYIVLIDAKTGGIASATDIDAAINAKAFTDWSVVWMGVEG